MGWGKAGFQTAGVGCMGKILIFHASIMRPWDAILFGTVCYLFLQSPGEQGKPQEPAHRCSCGRAAEIALRPPPPH